MKVQIKRDNLTLVGEKEIVDKSSYDLAIIFHGLFASKDYPLITEIATNLKEAGIASLRFDFNGHGESEGKFEDMTVLNELADANAILQYALNDKKIRNIYLVGHSQGGVVASMLAGLYPDKVKKLVLLAPAAVLKENTLKGIIPGQTFDPKNIPSTITLNGQKMGGFYFRTAQNLPIYEIAKKYQGPAEIVVGNNDKIAGIKYPKCYHEIYLNSEFHLIPNGDHDFSGEFNNIGSNLAVDFLTESEDKNNGR